jgi:hypothetical protein
MIAILLGELDSGVSFFLGLFALFMAIVWIIFPFTVMARLRDLIDLMEQSLKQLTAPDVIYRSRIWQPHRMTPPLSFFPA